MSDPKLLVNKFEIRFFGTLGVILVVLLVASFVFGNKVHRGNISSPAKVVIDPFEGIDLIARSVYVYDIRTNTALFTKNPNERMPLASLTKVMTALVALETAPAYSTIVVNHSAILSEGDSGLRVGERWTLGNLLDFSLVTSSNDGVRAVALALGALSFSNPTDEMAEGDFVSQMNRKADEIGMKNTYYFNVTGLDEPGLKGGAYGTAEDTAKLFSYALSHYPELFGATTQRQLNLSSLDNVVHTAKNTASIVNSIPGLKGSKTGFTDLAGGNLSIIFDPELGRPIVISVLGSTEEGRFKDVLNLITAVLQKISEGNENQDVK